MLRVRTQITSSSGGPYLNTFYFGTADSQAGAESAVTAVSVFWQTIKARWATTMAYATETEVAQLNVAGDVVAVYSVPSLNGTGTVAGVPLPFATQGLIRWRSGVYVAGKEIRGRTFVPGPLTADQTNGLPQAAYVNAVNGAATALRTSGAGLVVWSKKNATTAIVNGNSVWTNFASLRSRRD